MEIKYKLNIMDDNKYIDKTFYSEEDNKPIKINVYSKNTFIYGWGRNKYGELGLGNTNDVSLPNAIKSLKDIVITHISSGGKHTALLTNNGKLYVCGTDVLGLLGNDNTKKWKEQHKFQKLSNLDFENIIQVACAEFHTLCLTEEGSVYAWGGSLYNKLGQVNQSGLPLKINSLLNKKIIQISCGDYHSIALSNNYEVFSWGGGGPYNRGQCGHGDLKDVETPKKIEFFKGKKCIKIICGGYHTMVLIEDNLLFGFGKGTYGQCGYGVAEDTHTPKLVKFSRNCIAYEQGNISRININDESQSNIKEYKSPIVIKDIKCGGEHTLVLSSNGRLYSFGHGYTGQLGLGNNKNYERPTIVKSLIKKTVNQIAAGWSHSIVLTSQGFVYVAGCGKYGELGLSDNENRRSFTLIKSTFYLNMTNIFAGGHHSWIITDNIMPERLDVDSPSPLCTPNVTPNRSPGHSPRSLNDTRINERSATDIKRINNESKFTESKANINTITVNKSKPNTNIKFNLDNISDKILNNRSLLQIAFTDLKMSHRFIRFCISSNTRYKEMTFKEINAYISDYFNKDDFVILFSLQDDNEISNFKNPAMDSMFKDFRNNYKIIESKKNTFSLTIVYDMFKYAEVNDIKPNKFKKYEKRNVYDVINMNEDDIINNPYEKVLSNWVTDFMQNFSEWFENIDNINEFPRFLELRPYDYMFN